MYPRLFQFGPLAVPTYGVFTAFALLIGLAASMRLARRLALEPDKLWNAIILAIFAAVLASRVLLAIAYFDLFRAHPFWVLGLANIGPAWMAPSSAAIGLAAAILYLLAEGMPLLRSFDAIVPALALGMVFNRIGAFFAGSGYGSPTRSPWGVTYHSRIAWLWYRTPLGVKLHPLQIYQAAVSLLIFGVLLWWLPRRHREGEVAGAWLFLYGAASFLLASWSGAPQPNVLTVSQVFNVAGVLLGGALWLKLTPQPAPQASR